MNGNNNKLNTMIDKFKRLYRGTQGGIFTKKTRDKILTKKGISGRGRKKTQFWYRQRENVKTALIDLQLFIEAAGTENVKQVVTLKALRQIVDALLWHPVVDKANPDLVRAEIAQLFIQIGFGYLGEMKRNHITSSHSRTIEEAIDLSNYLVESFKPESERQYNAPYRGGYTY